MRRGRARAAALLAALVGVIAVAVWLERLEAPVPPAAEAPPAAAPPPPPAAARRAPVPEPGPPADAAPPPVRTQAGTGAPPAPLPEPAVDAEPEPSRELLRDAIAATIAQYQPSLKLSSDELEAATDALWRLREARLELKRLGSDPAHAERRAALVEAMGEASADFTYYVEMSPAAFTTLDRNLGGLSAPAPVVER